MPERQSAAIHARQASEITPSGKPVRCSVCDRARRTPSASPTAISFIGDFRTPGSVQRRCHPPPASENLHTSGHSHFSVRWSCRAAKSARKCHQPTSSAAMCLTSIMRCSGICANSFASLTRSGDGASNRQNDFSSAGKKVDRR